MPGISLFSACGDALLPASGILAIPGRDNLTLTDNAIFYPPCYTDDLGKYPDIVPTIIANGIHYSSATGVPVSNFQDPFYASMFPVCYALAATTVTSYMLILILLITPRSFLDDGVVYLGRRGFTSASSGSVSIGGRPWLQKVAALTVAISLTVASISTFRVAERQYRSRIQDARQLQREVLISTELQIIRLVSNTFLWLAQAQTLIRLFPRHREKVIIKWTAFGLIILDVIFSALNSFLYTNIETGTTRPGNFVSAIPALSYLFQLSLGVLYAAWVIYYSFMKKSYAFYHPLMKNMPLLAVVSLFSLLIPVVFFILDISKPEFAAWGDYVRWVGAAAASVVVWEWVERIEALEREEKKDGILGREVFDGDDVLPGSGLQVFRSRAHSSRSRPTRRKRNATSPPSSSTSLAPPPLAQTSGQGPPPTWPRSVLSSWRTRARNPEGNAHSSGRHGPEPVTRPVPSGQDVALGVLSPSSPQADGLESVSDFHGDQSLSNMTAMTVTSQSETMSAVSGTVYAIRRHPCREGASHEIGLREDDEEEEGAEGGAHGSASSDSRCGSSDGPAGGGGRGRRRRRLDEEYDGSSTNHARGDAHTAPSEPSLAARLGLGFLWSKILPTSQGALPSAAAAAARKNGRSSATEDRSRQPPPLRQLDVSTHHHHDWRGRLEEFVVTQADRVRDRFATTPSSAPPHALPVRIIPAPPRVGQALAEAREELAREEQAQARQTSTPAAPSPPVVPAPAPAPAPPRSSGTTSVDPPPRHRTISFTPPMSTDHPPPPSSLP